MRQYVKRLAGDYASHRKSRVITDSRYLAVYDSPSVIQEGALYYLKLAQYLGAFYWPSPQRAEFLAHHFSFKIGPLFVRQLGEYFDKEFESMLQEVLVPSIGRDIGLDFPGFGSAILSRCGKVDEILPMALEFRGSRGCQSFRQCLRLMDIALQKSDIKSLAQGLRDVREVLQATRHSLGLNDSKTQGGELHIGLSPSLTVRTRRSNPFLACSDTNATTCLSSANIPNTGCTRLCSAALRKAAAPDR
jgi:hypothetical protein